MRLLSNPNKLIVGFLLSWLLVAPAVAHEVETSSNGNVAATFHVEPGDDPKVGVPSRAWFALTRRGGRIIPLSQCNCQLAVYLVPYQEGKTPPLLKPALSSLDIKQYRGILGATIVFPRAGQYELKLTGKPKSGGDFQPFNLSYTITVRR
jgi:hypothetical protein